MWTEIYIIFLNENLHFYPYTSVGLLKLLPVLGQSAFCPLPLTGLKLVPEQTTTYSFALHPVTLIFKSDLEENARFLNDMLVVVWQALKA